MKSVASGIARPFTYPDLAASQAQGIAPEHRPTPRELAQLEVDAIRACFERLAFLSTEAKAGVCWPVDNPSGQGGVFGAGCIFDSIRAWAEFEARCIRDLTGRTARPQPFRVF